MENIHKPQILFLKENWNKATQYSHFVTMVTFYLLKINSSEFALDVIFLFSHLVARYGTWHCLLLSLQTDLWAKSLNASVLKKIFTWACLFCFYLGAPKSSDIQIAINLFLDFHLIDKVVGFHIFLEVRRPPQSLDQWRRRCGLWGIFEETLLVLLDSLVIMVQRWRIFHGVL